jgi:enoyl-CoA hydratase
MTRTYDTLDVQVEGKDDDVFTIKLTNGDLNLVDGTMHKELGHAFEDAYDADVRVVLLTGTGEAFSGGGDVHWMKEWIESPQYFEQILREGEEIIERLVNIEKPVVARLPGDAVGLGANLALCCDIVIASKEAQIGDPHVKVGLAAGDGGAVIWPLQLGLNKAKEFLMTGKLIDATEAKELGLINYAVPAEKLDAKVEEMIDELASLPQPAVRYSKQAANKWLQQGVHHVLRESLALESISARSASHEEAVEAFLDGREPDLPDARSPD